VGCWVWVDGRGWLLGCLRIIDARGVGRFWDGFSDFSWKRSGLVRRRRFFDDLMRFLGDLVTFGIDGRDGPGAMASVVRMNECTKGRMPLARVETILG
jgi:hypothetical protein